MQNIQDILPFIGGAFLLFAIVAKVSDHDFWVLNSMTWMFMAVAYMQKTWFALMYCLIAVMCLIRWHMATAKAAKPARKSKK